MKKLPPETKKKGNQMKKIILFLSILILFIPNIVYASEGTLSEEEIMQSQQESLDINSFIEEADK